MSVIALGPPNHQDKMIQAKENPYPIINPQDFVDEVYIDDQNVLSISVEKMFEEQPKRTRRSRWGAKEEKKVKQEINYQFDPLEAMMNRKAILPMNMNMNMGMNMGMGMNQLALNSMHQMNHMGFSLPGYNTGYTQPVEEKSSRWGPEFEKTFQPPSLNAIPLGLSIDNLEYIIRLYCLDEVYQKLQRQQDNKVVEDKDLRSPSPEPVYDSQGKRVNTRELRRKDNLLKTKANLIEECMKIRKTFVPPNDYRPMKKSRKIYLTDAIYAPDINYIGLIIGPKGITQKMLESKSNCKISIRGKGASKTKRVEFDSDDKLHVLIQADSDENLDKGVALVEKLLRGEDEDEFKKNQRLQLQVISGVLRDDFCELCHEKGHRSWACPSKLAWAKADVKCDICGERSHPTNDCPKKGYNRTAYIQSQYNKMMNEVEMNPVTFQTEGSDAPKERINFITEASFTGFNLYKQLLEDPEAMAEMKKQQSDMKKDQQAQVQAINSYTLNKPEFQSIQQEAKNVGEQNMQLQQQYMNYGYQNNNYMNPSMYYGYSGYSGFGVGGSNQLQLTNFNQQQPQYGQQQQMQNYMQQQNQMINMGYYQQQNVLNQLNPNFNSSAKTGAIQNLVPPPPAISSSIIPPPQTIPSQLNQINKK